MLFEDLATELITQVYLSCNAISDVIALSSTCHRFRKIYKSSQNFAILENAAETQFGPLQDLTQVITYNESQIAHHVRQAPFSMALLKQMVRYGRVAEKWCDLYPFKKWKHDYESRRLLDTDERYRLRRAIYRFWLYSRAFHNSLNPRIMRDLKFVVRDRGALLKNWSNIELAEIADVHAIIRDVVHGICPSNGSIARKFKKRYPENEHALLFNIHLNYPSPTQTHNPFAVSYHTTSNSSSLSSLFNNTPTYTSRYATTKYSLHPSHDVGAEGWGDDIPHYYVIEDMLKLDPEQILWLKENCPLKGMVEGYVSSLGPWFENNGETWVPTLDMVLGERGEDVGEFMEGIGEGRLGVARAVMF